jgi:transketolase
VAAADQLAAEGISASVGIVACPLELDDEAMRIALGAPVLITVEDHHVRTGLGASVAEWMALRSARTRFVRLGVADYQTSGTAADVLERNGLGVAGILRASRRRRAG